MMFFFLFLLLLVSTVFVAVVLPTAAGVIPVRCQKREQTASRILRRAVGTNVVVAMHVLSAFSCCCMPMTASTNHHKRRIHTCSIVRHHVQGCRRCRPVSHPSIHRPIAPTAGTDGDAYTRGDGDHLPMMPLLVRPSVPCRNRQSGLQFGASEHSRAAHGEATGAVVRRRLRRRRGRRGGGAERSGGGINSAPMEGAGSSSSSSSGSVMHACTCGLPCTGASRCLWLPARAAATCEAMRLRAAYGQHAARLTAGGKLEAAALAEAVACNHRYMSAHMHVESESTAKSSGGHEP
uniref:Secreted protein n=1 Tax=Oryza punctata TaxID=4537 RepID=A0A0E0LW65_ORYPU